MTLKTMVNAVQDATGLPRSTVVVSSTNPLVRRVLALANTEGRELAKRHSWEALETEKTFTSTATEEQTGQIPADLERFISETFFNRTRDRAVQGPLTPRQWQAQKSLTANLLTDGFRVRAGQILMTPVPAAGDEYAYEYITNQWCEGGAGVGQSAWVLDDDVGRISEDLMELGLRWRVKASLGADYAEDFNNYEIQVMQAIARDGTRRTISFAHGRSPLESPQFPSLPEGSWSL